MWLMAINYWLLDGKSLQWSTPPAVMHVLQNYGCRTELFASPMNVYQDNTYYSLFHADRYFASRGNFFNAPNEHFASGVYQINPPFIDVIFSRCTSKITELLEAADNSDRELTFIYIMPDWDDFKTLQELRGHKYCIRDIYLSPGSHNYYQYGHNNYIRATFGTHVIILSTNPSFCNIDLERDIVRAFRCGGSHASALSI
jgi:hypothetical protein